MDFKSPNEPTILVSTNRSRLDVNVIYGFLTESYWAQGRSRDAVLKTIENSLCFGAFIDGNQVGFARVITDYATVALLCDVFVLEQHRSRGVGRFLMECVLGYPDLQAVKWSLRTRDAHGLYEKFGFKTSQPTFRAMEREPLCS